MRSGPVERTLDFPYHPHVTVAHHLEEAALDRAFESLADFRCDFRVGSIELYPTTTTGSGACGSFPWTLTSALGRLHRAVDRSRSRARSRASPPADRAGACRVTAR